MILYHGSPYGGLTSLSGATPPFFLTSDIGIARDYATVDMVGAQKDPGMTTKTPTVYHIDYSGKPFDMRDPGHAQIYNDLRQKLLASDPDEDLRYDYPKPSAPGFIDARLGLPLFSKERPIYNLVQHLGFDAVWMSEGSQGPSLALFKPGMARIIQQEKLQRKPTMNIEDKLAKALLMKHAGFLKSAQGEGWFTSIESQLETQEQLEYRRAKLLIGDVELECMIAEEGDAQIQGLQGHSSLGPYEAMIFPNEQPRRVAFHMGEVSFPIDMIFIGDDSRVTRIVENIEPGTPGNWGMPHISAVVEVNGLFCRSHGIEVGSEVRQPASKAAQAHGNVDKLISMLGDAMYVGDDAAANAVAKHIEKMINSGIMTPDEANGRLSDYMEMISEAPRIASRLITLDMGDQNMAFDDLVDDLFEFDVQFHDGSLTQSHWSIPNGFDMRLILPILQKYQVQIFNADDYPMGGNMPPASAGRQAQAKFTPAFLNAETGQIIPSPGFHNIDVLTLEARLRLDDLDNPWQAGFIDNSGKFYTRDEAMQAGARVAQEIFPSYPRKDINPKMVTPNVTRDRFKDRDLVDEQVNSQPHDPANYDEMSGYDQGRTEEQNEGIGPNVRPL